MSNQLATRGRKEPKQVCISESEKLSKFEGLPRDEDTSWRTEYHAVTGSRSGHHILRSANTNKLLTFSHRERQLLSIHGLLPIGIRTMEQQVEITAQLFDTMKTEFQRTLFMMYLEMQNRCLFYRLLMKDNKFMNIFHNAENDFMLRNYSYVSSNARAMFITIKDRGHIYEVLRNWPQRHSIRCLIVSTGECVLSTGDHGVNGGAAVFLKMYQSVVYGGIHPDCFMPVCLDVGTNNEHLLKDPLYMGLRERRTSGPEFAEFFEEFALAVIRLFGPRAIMQVKDFNTADALNQLALYGKRQCYIDIDVQCMAACALAGLLGANQYTGEPFRDNVMLFYGESAINLGMAYMCLNYLKSLGLNEASAKEKIWFCDSHGLVVRKRCKAKMAKHLEEFQQMHEHIESLIDVIMTIRPNVLIGNAMEPGVFTKDVLRAMEQVAKHPIIFANSRPTRLMECTAEDAFVYTKGRCVFITGNKLPPVKYANKWYQPGYCSSQYLLAGLVHGVMLSGMQSVPDEIFLVAAQRLAKLIWPTDLAMRNVYPPGRKTRCVNMQIAEAVFTFAYRRRLATNPEPANPTTYIASKMFSGEYGPAIPEFYCTSNVMIGTTESLQYYQQKI